MQLLDVKSRGKQLRSCSGVPSVQCGCFQHRHEAAMYQPSVPPSRSNENDARESKNVKSTNVPVDAEIKQVLPKPVQERGQQPKTMLERVLCDPKCVIRLKELLHILKVSRSTVYLRINPKSKYYDPMFPKTIPLGMKAKGWVLEDVYAYIEHLRYQQEIA